MATELIPQAGFYDDGKVQWGLDTVTHALVPNPLNSGLVDIGAADALVGTIYSASGFPTNTPLLTSAYGAILKPFFLEEEMDPPIGGVTSDSTANLLPANSLIVAVTARITVILAGGVGTTWSLGDAATADRFTDANATLAAGTTDISVNQWDQSKAAGYTPWQAAAAKLRITADGAFATGKLHVTVFGFTVSAPTA